MSADGFAFLDGRWHVRNRRLADFLDPESGWKEFEGHTTGRLFWDGRAHVDEIVFPTEGFSGLTLRLYEPETGEWTLNWSNSRTGRLDPPVRGRFASDGTGEFHGTDSYAGRPVRVRFRWSGISARTARWEQAFAAEGTDAWVTNWVMEFSRA
ncbi:hypothetical protein [Streptomyces sp. TLI_105]|uniref:hypothetical protein n=1 Tax=Streptomyces sp. TLI_105 TaxID=1881019 RepID=UPI000B87B1D1|nr:hypothetical protein [Streptomyces sp. TLI_105]